MDDNAHRCTMAASKRGTGIRFCDGDTQWCNVVQVPVQHRHPNFTISQKKSKKQQQKVALSPKLDFGAAKGAPLTSEAVVDELAHSLATTTDRSLTPSKPTNHVHFENTLTIMGLLYMRPKALKTQYNFGSKPWCPWRIGRGFAGCGFIEHAGNKHRCGTIV